MMDQGILSSPLPTPVAGGRGVFTWLSGIVCFGFLLLVMGLIARQMIVPPRAPRIILLRNIPLPEGLKNKGAPDSLAAGTSQFFDHFDFESIDFNTHLLFMAHTGPVPDNQALYDPGFNVENPADIARDGNVLVFDLQTQQLVGRLPIPQVAGLVVAPDLHKVFAADAQENKICSFDEPSTPLQGAALLDFFGQRARASIQCAQLDDFENPDAIAYDPVDHKIFVSDPGSPPDNCDPKMPLDQNDCVAKIHGQAVKFNGKTIPTLNRRPTSQNISVVDALHPTRVITKIAVGTLPVTASERASMESIPADDPGKVNIVKGNIAEFGRAIGHVKYDAVSHKVYAVTQISLNKDDASAGLPPPGTAEFLTIDPVTDTIIRRDPLPATCGTPHGLALDEGQHQAFIACTDVDPGPPRMVQHLMRWNLDTMKPGPEEANPDQTLLAPAPDIVQVIHFTSPTPADIVFVGGGGGISVFDETNGQFKKLGDYAIGHETHTIAVDPGTGYIYLPVPGVGGRPTLHVAQYNPNGV
jgi:DNA-binding beta-propeller fold protein YncE